MIEINLLPPELKEKIPQSDGIPPIILYVVLPLAILVLLLAHGSLGVVAAVKGYQLSTFNNEWKKTEPQRKQLAEFNLQSKSISQDSMAIQQLVSQGVNWSEKLARLSMDLPPGVWFEDLMVDKKNFYVKGSVVALDKGEVGVINKFLNALRGDTAFMKDFSNLELGPLRWRTVGGYNVVDFELTGALK